jgi:SAP domain-containing new25/Domain of unknown function (DUF6434)
MKDDRGTKGMHRKPSLLPGMSVAEFMAYYWMKAELVEFAKRLGLPTHGYKPELSARIERRLRGLPDGAVPAPKPTRGQRDADKPLRRDTLVVNYKSDDKTRAFFTAQIGPHFHFTYHLNQFRLTRKNLTYGDLIDEWVSEYERRKAPSYKAPIPSHGEYNRYIRDFFADKQNEGRSFGEAAASWNAAKQERGDRRYKPQRKRTRKS